MNDSFYMHLALQEAWKFQGITYPNPAVGAVIVKDGVILAIATHQKAGGPHAEVLACAEAFVKLSGDTTPFELVDAAEIHEYLYLHHNDHFVDATIYVTLEPCNHYGKTPPCSLLLQTLKFKRVVIGQRELHPKASGGGENLPSHFMDLGEAYDLAMPFFRWSEGRFVFFKLAQHLNGTYDGGQISCAESTHYVHALRNRIDLLIIGGETVRNDRPTLNSRIVGGRAPDVLILSHTKEFDTTIPLFSVPHRRVMISDSLEAIKNYKFIMIEGGERMLQTTRHILDGYLFFIAPSTNEGKHLTSKLEMRILHTNAVGVDIAVWAEAKNTDRNKA